MKRKKQPQFFSRVEEAYGGTLRNTRKGRSAPRPLCTKRTMHLVLRSTQAVGALSFASPKNRPKVNALVKKFAQKNGVKIHSLANVGNHIHIHFKLSTRHTYRAFIRGLTAALAIAIAGVARLKKMPKKFWDYRPFTRVVALTRRSFLVVEDYLRVNQLEGLGVPRDIAEFSVRNAREQAGNGTWAYEEFG